MSNPVGNAPARPPAPAGAPGTSHALDDAFRHCEAVTRAEAANFFYGIRLLPRRRRRAISAVYAFARRVDDIGDGTLGREEKLRLLDGEARGLAGVEASRWPVAGAGAGSGAAVEISANGAQDPVMLALAEAYRTFPLPAGALGELIEGVRMDVLGVTYDGFEELVLYCRRVAGAIGRVSLAIFGLRDPARTDRAAAEKLADELGVAMQLTNILRDVREDAENGRVYLPSEDLRRFGVIEASEAPDPALVLSRLSRSQQEIAPLVRFEARRARQWFQRGIALTGMLDRRSAASVLAMAGIYMRLLDRIEAEPDRAARSRVSLPVHEMVWVAARGMLGGATCATSAMWWSWGAASRVSPRRSTVQRRERASRSWRCAGALEARPTRCSATDC
jgi:phytoene synthase